MSSFIEKQGVRSVQIAACAIYPHGLSGATSATVTTMLFGCHHWLQHHSDSAAGDTLDRIQFVKRELETWLAERGLQYWS
jgi:hypothetical protein